FDLSPESVAYTRYAEDMGRFISEYGIQPAPVMETLTRCLPEDQRYLGSDGLLYRIKDRPKNKVDAMLVSVTGLPATLDEYVDYTQITQAEGLKFGVEHFVGASRIAPARSSGNSTTVGRASAGV
ncbi:MAG: hypothetical protein WBW31_11355, partial [Candidatus Sulfotelmatobacter sp.]